MITEVQENNDKKSFVTNQKLDENEEQTKRPFQMKSNKELYRMIAFNYHQNTKEGGINIQIIQDFMVNLYYPLRTEEDQERKQYFKLVKSCLEEISINNVISEDQFSNALENIKLNEQQSNIFYKKMFKSLDKYKEGNLNIQIILDWMVNYNYPLRTEEDIDRKQYSKLVKKCLEQKSKNNLISEDQFCSALENIEPYVTQTNQEIFYTRMFRRFDKDKDGILNYQEFLNLIKQFNDPELNLGVIQQMYSQIVGAENDGINQELFLSLFRI